MTPGDLLEIFAMATRSRSWVPGMLAGIKSWAMYDAEIQKHDESAKEVA
jgi:hypothetical protein